MSADIHFNTTQLQYMPLFVNEHIFVFFFFTDIYTGYNHILSSPIFVILVIFISPYWTGMTVPVFPGMSIRGMITVLVFLINSVFIVPLLIL